MCNDFYLEILKFVRDMMAADIKVLYVDVRENHNMNSALKINYYKLGLFLDLNCQGSEIIFNQVWYNNYACFLNSKLNLSSIKLQKISYFQFNQNLKCQKYIIYPKLKKNSEK